MPEITVNISGKRKTAVVIIEDKNGTPQMLDLKQNSGTVNVSGGGLATFTIVAAGDPGDELTVTLTNATNGQIGPSRTYAFTTRSSIKRAFKFDPDA